MVFAMMLNTYTATPENVAVMTCSGPSGLCVTSCQVLSNALLTSTTLELILQPMHADPRAHPPSGRYVGCAPVTLSPCSSSIVRLTRRPSASTKENNTSARERYEAARVRYGVGMRGLRSCPREHEGPRGTCAVSETESEAAHLTGLQSEEIRRQTLSSTGRTLDWP